jgi:16S rRNA (guanine1207-N2)-methyltransferase
MRFTLIENYGEENYFHVHSQSARLNSRDIHFLTKPGIPNWNTIPPASVLIAVNIVLPPHHRVLLLGCENPALAIFIAGQLHAGELFIFEPNFLSNQLTSRSLVSNGLHNSLLLECLDDKVAEPLSFDEIIISLPKGRKLAQRWLTHGKHYLTPGGILYLAGANKLGIQTVIRDGEQLLGSAAILAYKKGNRLVKFSPQGAQRPVPGWSQEPGIAPGTWFIFPGPARLESQDIYSLPGIFSFDRLDPGTSLLLETTQDRISGNVLDLGCGYGIIGLMSAKSGASRVDMIDNNLLAISATKKNMEYHCVPNAEALPSDALTAVLDRQYSLILTNPPFHTGRDVNYQITQVFIRQSWHVLQRGGSLCLVANRFIRYDQLMKSVFSNVTCLSQTEKFAVYESIKG